MRILAIGYWGWLYYKWGSEEMMVSRIDGKDAQTDTMMKQLKISYNHNITTTQMEGVRDTVQCKGKTFKLLYSPQQIRAITETLANQINNYYGAIFKEDPNAKLVAVCILRGAFIFFADLVRLFNFQCEVDFLRVSSYEGTHAGKHKMAIPVESNRYQGKYVLVVQDIYDTGATLKYLHGCLSEATDKKIDTVVLIKRKQVGLQIDLKFVGMECSGFIVGYGLDLDEEGRNLQGIYEIVDK